MANNLDDLQKALAPLKKRFAEQLPEKIKSLNALWVKASAAEAIKNDWDDFYILAHKLAGSGSTFGFDEISHIARKLELLIGNARISLVDFEKNKSEIVALLQILNHLQIK